MMNNKTIRFATGLSLLLAAAGASAQVQLSPVLVGTAGGTGTAGNMTISWSAGEVAITTESNSSNILTQGFHQPMASQSMEATATATDATCKTSFDGTALISVSNGVGPYTYDWSPNVTTTDSASGLEPGNYLVIVTDVYGRVDTAGFTIGVANDADCQLHIYSGFTPNGDAHNELWEIDGITFFPDNTVKIFNRWGDKVWEGTAYDNNTVVWSGQSNDGGPLPEGTYFYIITIPNSQYTGWVELTR